MCPLSDLNLRRHYVDGTLAFGLACAAQLLICGLQHATTHINNFPAPIIAMGLVAFVVTVMAALVKGVDCVYQKYLKRPVSCHSIMAGVPFTDLIACDRPTCSTATCR
jgi:hypothetical protein